MKEIIGKRIRKIRESKDLSQENVAGELNMTTSAYSKIERGVTDPATNKLLKIAEILEVDVTEFFIDIKKKYSKAKAEEQTGNYGFATKKDIEEIMLVIQEVVKEVTELKSSLNNTAIPIKKGKGKK